MSIVHYFLLLVSISWIYHNLSILLSIRESEFYLGFHYYKLIYKHSCLSVFEDIFLLGKYWEKNGWIPYTGQFKQQKFMSHSFGGWHVRDQVSADYVSSESCLLGLQTIAFLHCPHKARREGVSSVVSPAIRIVILSYQSSFLIISFNLNYLLTPSTATLGIKASTYEFWRDIFQAIALST